CRGGAPGTEIEGGGTALFHLPAVLIVVVLTLLLMRGTKEPARLNNIMVAVKLAVVLAFIGLGWRYTNSANWTPLIPPNDGTFGHYGYSGILRGA
ncbi:hypothetical protein ACRERF_14790, partial [Lacticaseibacillus rhamnosus]